MKFWHFLAMALLLHGCLVRRPAVSGQQNVVPVVQHANFISTAACQSCHEVDRPAPIEEAPHGGGHDCLMCHLPKDDQSGWLPVTPFTHTPPPTTCLECHAKARPPSPHIQVVDCVLCHKYGSFQKPLPGATDNGPPPAGTTLAPVPAALQGVNGR